DVQATAVTLSWTSGGGVGRIVVAEAGTSVQNDPVDGTSYAANSDFTLAEEIVEGGSRVVYAGTDDAVTITGLSSDTEYTFKVFEYSECNGTSPDYNLDDSSGNPVTITTL